MRTKYPLIYMIVLFSVAGLLALAGNGDNGPTLNPSPALAANPTMLPLLEGTWAGSWSDTVFNVGGAMTFVIWAEGSNYAATGTIDVTSISPALGVLTGGAIGLDSGASLDVTFNCTELGNGTVVLTPVKSANGIMSASGSGSGNVTGALNFGPFTMNGSASDTDLSGSFDFTSPGGGKGVAEMTKTSVAVEPASWGSVKAKYRDR